MPRHPTLPLKQAALVAITEEVGIEILAA